MAELTIYATQTPDTADSNSPAGQRELGAAFQSSINTFAVAMRYYAATTAPGGNPVGELWSVATATSNTGTLLTSQTLSSGSVVTGTWNRINFASPVALTAGNWYVVSVWLPDHYAFHSVGDFPITNGTLSTADGTNAGGNGRFSNGVAAGNLPQVQTGSTGFDFLVDIITNPTPGGGAPQVVVARQFAPGRPLRTFIYLAPAQQQAIATSSPAPIIVPQQPPRPLLRSVIYRTPDTTPEPAPPAPVVTPARAAAPLLRTTVWLAPTPPAAVVDVPAPVVVVTRTFAPPAPPRALVSLASLAPVGPCDPLTHRPVTGSTSRPYAGVIERPGCH